MSYTTSNDFLLINKISIETMYENLLKNDTILLDVNGDSVEHLRYINGYMDNLIKKEVLDITINNLFNNKIIYYNNSDKYPDTYVIDYNKSKLYNIIDIDNSYYASENIKKYMFLYDFLAEYYRNLSIIKKNKFAIDNKSLYEHTFEMKMRYIYKNDFSGNKTIINLNNDDTNIYYYLISFKLQDQVSKDLNEELLIQPTGYITDLIIDKNTSTDDHKNVISLPSDKETVFLESFRDLFNNIIKKEHLIIDTELSYYHLIAQSYKFKFHKLLLSYYVSKTIYFYFKQNYKTKIKEINTIIGKHYPIALQNFNMIINNSKPESLINIMKNSEKKIYEVNKNKQTELDKITYSLSKLNIEKNKISRQVKNNGLKYSEEKLKKLQNRFNDIDKEINTLELKYDKVSKTDYLTRDSAEIQEAIDYKSKLHDFNNNIDNNVTKIKQIKDVTKQENKYINNLNIINYFILFLFIVLIFIFILDYSTSIVNISIPITLLAITITSYLIINYAVKNRFSNLDQYNYSSNQSLIKNLYDSIGGRYLENFEDGEEELDPIVKDIVENSLQVGSNEAIKQMDTLLSIKIDADVEKKIYFTIPNTDYKIDIINKMIDGTDSDTIGLNYSNFWTGWPSQGSGQINKDIQFLRESDSTDDVNIIAFANDQNMNNKHTIYTFNIPEGIDYFPCQVLVVGGGSFGGYIATRKEFDDLEGVLPPVTNMGEGGAGGAVILQNLNLTPGKYEFGVGRGGYWINDDLERSIIESQAASSYIKNSITGDIYVLAKGSQYEKYTSSSIRKEHQFNQQISAGKLHGNKADDVGENIKNGVGTLGRSNNYSNGGRGGLIKPKKGQLSFTYLEALGDKVDTYYLSSHRYEGTELSGTNGNDGVDISAYFGTYYNNGVFAAGGGASSFCKVGEDSSFHEVDGKWYTCSSTDDRAGIGGNGGGGNGSATDIGFDALHGSGSGGGGGKYAGGNGGAGIILLKYDIASMRAKINDKISSTKLILKESIYDIGVQESNKQLRQKKIAIAEYLREINNDKADIAAKYREIGVLIDQGKEQDGLITEYDDLIREAETQQRLLRRKIENYNTEINDYNQKIAILSTDKDNKNRELEKLNLEIELQETKYKTEKKNVVVKEKEERLKNTAIAENKAEYLKNIANRLKAEACKKALIAAEMQKAKEILANKKIEMKMKKELMAEAEKKRIAAIKETIKSESDRDTALQEQYEAEQEYKEAKEDLITWEKNLKLDESDKSYSVAFRLEIDYRIAGINGFDESFFEGLEDDSNISKMRESLLKEREKREYFISNIKKELISATSELKTLPNRYDIIRIHSGNLVKREEIQTEKEKEEARKMKIINDFERSKFDNEYNTKEEFTLNTFSTFKVTEHFVIDDTTEEALLLRPRTEGYVPPDNVMVIEMQILPHPQSKSPYAKEILDELILQSNRLDSKLRSSSRYFRFLNGYKVQDEDWVLVQRGRGVLADVDVLLSNKERIDDIKTNFGIIKNLQSDLPSYYDNVNPLLKKEVRVYTDKNHQINLYNKISKTSQNVRYIDIRKKELTMNFILSLCILISVTSILLKFMNNPIIFIIFLVIFMFLLINYIYNMTRIVNTKHKKNYWLKPNNLKLVNASDD